MFRDEFVFFQFKFLRKRNGTNHQFIKSVEFFFLNQHLLNPLNATPKVPGFVLFNILLFSG